MRRTSDLPMKTFVFDIDGTIADCSHRLHYIQGVKKDYGRFYENCGMDEPIKDVIALVKSLYDQSFNIVFCTGRSESCRRVTEMWLTYHIGINFKLIMRAVDDHRPDSEAKVKALVCSDVNTMGILGIFEDRDQMVKAWREQGFRCYQVKDGNY